MRPVGEVRQTLVRVLAERGPGTSRALAATACAGYEATRRTLGDMLKAGQVEQLEPVRVPGVRRPVPVYALVAA